LTVAHLVTRHGMLVLNADDDVLRRKAASLPERLGSAVPALGWFALDWERQELREHRKRDGATAGVRGGRLHLAWHGREHDLGAVDAMPLTLQGHARYNVANLAGAALAAAALGVPPVTIAGVFARFGLDPADNPGRLVRFVAAGAQVLVDYAHNPDGLRGVLQVARALRGPGGRLIVLLGHAGNRRDEDLVEVAQVAASFDPGLVIVKEDEAHLRGRRPGEVPELLRRALLAAGLSPATVMLRMTELDAARCALQAARTGDAVALLVHSGAAREAVLALLQDPAGG
jgi:cyanophycin synthetase